jgi:hypothetical protein
MKGTHFKDQYHAILPVGFGDRYRFGIQQMAVSWPQKFLST